MLLVAIGAFAHGLHWWVLHAGASVAVAAFLSCLLAGVILVPVSHYMRIPFAGIGFASVVALVPGVYVFRTLSDFAQFASHPSPALLSAAASDRSGSADAFFRQRVVVALDSPPSVGLCHGLREKA